jgi:aryl-alcohol dehydrogenase
LFNKTVSGILMGHAGLPGTIAKLIEAIQSGEFPIDRLITFCDFADINQAIVDSEKGRSIKAIVIMPI